MTTSLIALLASLCLFASTDNGAARKVTAEEAESHLNKKVEPVTPALAKTLRLGGDVKVSFTISQTGDVTNLKAISGHPILIQAVLDAVRQWKYRPFLLNDQPVAVATEVTVNFPGGMSAKEQEIRNKYFPIEHKCRSLLNSGRYAEAEGECRRAIQLADQLPENVVLERTEPRSLLAHAIFLQHRINEAIPLYEEALKMDRGYRKPDDADLASDYANLARARGANGEAAVADPLYATSVSTFEAAIKSLPDMKENYTRRLQRVLNEYAQLKDIEGQKDAAEQLRQRAKALQ